MKIGVYLFIVIGGLLQACGSAMNAQLYRSLKNPWLASFVSFALIVALFLCLVAMFPRPIPAREDVLQMPWWAPLAGLVGAVAVYAGLKLVGEVGAGTYTALNVTAALAMSIAIDHFGLLHVAEHRCTIWRLAGTVLMAAGVILISKF